MQEASGSLQVCLNWRILVKLQMGKNSQALQTSLTAGASQGTSQLTEFPTPTWYDPYICTYQRFQEIGFLKFLLKIICVI